MPEKEPLMTLKTQADGRVDMPDAQDSGPSSSPSDQRQDGLPLLGLFAVGFGFLSIFTFAPVFVPLALIFGLIAIFMGQIMLGLTSLVLALAGVLTSPSLMLVLGLGALATWFGFPL